MKHRFKKGESGNPKGRPKGTVSIVTELKKRLLTCPPGQKRTYLELAVDRILQMAIANSNEQMLKLIVNYTDGLPLQKITGDAENPIPIIIQGLTLKDYPEPKK